MICNLIVYFLLAIAAYLSYVKKEMKNLSATTYEEYYYYMMDTGKKTIFIVTIIAFLLFWYIYIVSRVFDFFNKL